jgi:hypothetical protein
MPRKPRSEAGAKALHPKGPAKRKTAAKPDATAKPAEPADNRRANGQFGRGNRANPGGRPKEAAEIRELAREHTVEAINRLVEWMRSEEPKASVQACNAILDRGWGKAAQPLEHEAKGSLALLLAQIGGSTARLVE